MTILGLDIAIWVVLAIYFAGMLLLGWWSKRQAQDREGYLLGNRQFGVWYMIMHAFGAGTNPGDAAGVVSKTVAGGASGIWVSWMWMFGTPFYWLIAPICRRMRCLTLADYYRERFGRGAAVLYTLIASISMTIFFGGVLLATTRTVQGMMGQATTPTNPAAVDWWFYGILLVTTVVFVVYGYWGGIVAAIRTDMAQGIMIIILSFLAVPLALGMSEVAGFSGMRETLRGADPGHLRLFHPTHFSLGTIILLCIQAPLSALALPHLMSVTSAGKTEWEGRMGFAGGNILKRICTIGWSILGLAWLAYLIRTGSTIRPDAAFGDAIQRLLPTVLQGLMLACVMAASMSSGDAVQVTVAGLWTQSIYREYINPEADEHRLLAFTKITGIFIIAVSVVFAVVMQNSLVKSIIMYFNILAIMGISTAMGILWRRMNQTGVIASAVAASIVFVLLRTPLVPGCPMWAKIGVPIVTGVMFGFLGSLLAAPPRPEVIDGFFKRIYVPIGEEDKLDLPLDEAVPPSRRLCTLGGLFLVWPSLQSVVGFLVIAAICAACVVTMLAILG
ncbi:sodium:solute symporter [Planctomycetota bacterium]